MTKPNSVAVYIGRFQPPHQGHLATAMQALDTHERLIIAVGSSHAAPSPKNPFSFDQRQTLWRKAFGSEGLRTHNVTIVPLRDYLYNNQRWVAEVSRKVYDIAGPKAEISLIGHKKDASSFYLDFFPDWKFVPAKVSTVINGTDVRRAFFEGGDYTSLTPPLVWGYMDLFKDEPAYGALKDEHNFLIEYRKKWAGTQPWSPIYTTVDAFVESEGHVLLIERGQCPGKGTFALPGGFLDSQETLVAGMLRELYEETGLAVSDSAIKAYKVFDHPNRSQRARIVTHAYHLGIDSSYPVVGRDDAKRAFWMPIREIWQNEDRFFEDHFQMIEYFITKGAYHG